MTSCLTSLGSACMTIDNFCFYLQSRLIQTSQTGGQWYSNSMIHRCAAGAKLQTRTFTVCLLVPFFAKKNSLFPSCLPISLSLTHLSLSFPLPLACLTLFPSPPLPAYLSFPHSSRSLTYARHSKDITLCITRISIKHKL